MVKNVKITRRLEWGRIPLPNAVEDSTGQFSIAEVPLRDLTEATNPAGNILIMPNDVISVPKAEMVYVIGDVVKSGGIVLGGQQQITVLQAVSMAAGLTKTAKSKEAKILRLNTASAKRDEVPIDLKALLAGKIDDVPMQADDILFVPWFCYACANALMPSWSSTRVRSKSASRRIPSATTS